MNIPLSQIYVDEEIKHAIVEVLDSGWYILGEKVKEFEEKFAKYCQVKNAVAVSSGTAALFLSLKASCIGPGDEVIVPSFSFIATASPIIHCGAKPILVDIDPKTYNIDVLEIKKKISKKTKMVIPVHLYGHPADVDSIKEVVEGKNILILEDSCQAHGAEYKKRKTGSLGDIGCFSFYPSKNMTVCGDGGIVTSNNDTFIETIRSLRDHGRKEKYSHDIIGYNMRFNEIQAVIGIIQLKKLPEWIERRRYIANIYEDDIKINLIKPFEEKWAKHVYYMYVIRSDKRDKLQTYLKNKGISTGIHYPISIHEQPAITNILGKIKLPLCEKFEKEILSLPMYPQLTEEQMNYLCNVINSFN